MPVMMHLQGGSTPSVIINSVAVVSGWANATAVQSIIVNYTAIENETVDFDWYRSEDAEGEFSIDVAETTLGVAVTAGTHDVDIAESDGYRAGSHYVQVKLSTDSFYVASNLFNVMVLDHLDVIADPQYSGELFAPQPSFQVTSNGAVGAVPIYWEVRNNLHVVVASGSQNFNILNGTNTYTFSGLSVPVSVGTNRDFRIGTTATMELISNHFEIQL